HYHDALYSAFFFHATPTPSLSTLSLHDALPISLGAEVARIGDAGRAEVLLCPAGDPPRVLVVRLARDRVDHLAEDRERRRFRERDRKSTRLNSSHRTISYAVFCLKKKKIVNGEA